MGVDANVGTTPFHGAVVLGMTQTLPSHCPDIKS